MSDWGFIGLQTSNRVQSTGEAVGTKQHQQVLFKAIYSTCADFKT